MIKKVLNGCAIAFWLIISLALILSSVWAYFEHPKVEAENQKWLSLLKSGKVDCIWLTGARGAEQYNEIDTIRINNRNLINQAAQYLKASQLIPINSVNFKAQQYMCDATLFSGNNSYKLYLFKLPDGRGLVETSRSDSLYKDTRLIAFLDSIFQEGIKHKSYTR